MLPYFPDAIQNWDVSVLQWIQSNVWCPLLDKIFPVLTLFGEGGIFWIAIAFVFLFFKKTRKTGIMMGAALLIGVFFVNVVLKIYVFGRVRPYDLANPISINPCMLTKMTADTSFPSGHSLASFECATVLMYKNRKWGIAALVIAIAVALSRLYLCVHFPTDVIGGVILGILNGILGILIVNAVYKKLEEKNIIHID